MSVLGNALLRFAEAVEGVHPELARGARMGAILTDEQRRAELARALEERGRELTERVVDAAVNGRRR